MRQRFSINTSVGVTKGDTGAPAQGEPAYFRWVPTTVDTGQPATITIGIDLDEGDTGAGYIFYNSGAVNLGAQLTKGFVSTDTGTRVAFGGERARIKIAPADTGVVLAGTGYLGFA